MSVNASGKIMNRTRTKAALYGIVSFDRPWKYVLRSTSSTHVKLDLYRPDRVQNCGDQFSAHSLGARRYSD